MDFPENPQKKVHKNPHPPWNPSPTPCAARVRGAALGGEVDGDAVAVRGEGHRGAEGGQHLTSAVLSHGKLMQGGAPVR